MTGCWIEGGGNWVKRTKGKDILVCHSRIGYLPTAEKSIKGKASPVSDASADIFRLRVCKH